MAIQTLKAGTYELALGDVLVPSELLGDITVNYDEATTEASTQAGTRVVPLGKPATAEATFTLYLPSIDYLQNLWEEAYTAKSGTGDAGNIIFGNGSCQTREGLPINIHNVCDSTDANDIHIYNGIVKQTFNPTLSAGEVLQVESTIYMQPTDNGYIRLGSGDPTQKSHYDVASQSTVAGEES